MPAALAASQSLVNQLFVEAALALPEPSVAFTNTKRTPEARTDFQLIAAPPSWLCAETSIPRKVPDGAASAAGAMTSTAIVVSVAAIDTANTRLPLRSAALRLAPGRRE